MYIYTYYKIYWNKGHISIIYLICSVKCRLSLATSVLGDSYGPPTETHAKWKNKLERNFQISQYHLISHRHKYIMGYTIVSGKKPSSVSLNQNHTILFIEMLE